MPHTIRPAMFETAEASVHFHRILRTWLLSSLVGFALLCCGSLREHHREDARPHRRVVRTPNRALELEMDVAPHRAESRAKR